MILIQEYRCKSDILISLHGGSLKIKFLSGKQYCALEFLLAVYYIHVKNKCFFLLKVIRQVDHMSVPVTTKHKCSLFESEIPAITYNSGGTYTLGALLEVRVVNENIYFYF